MKKIISVIAMSSILGAGLYANEIEEKESNSDFYVAVKAMATLGSSIDEETTTLKGSIGKGLGIDLGYEVSHGFSVEVDGTYIVNTVTETDRATGDSRDLSASYATNSLDIAYKYMATEALGLVAKCGYEYEFEKIPDLNVDKTSSGFVYAAALVYEVSEHMAVLGEYEVTTIKGPRGNSAFAGIEYSF